MNVEDVIKLGKNIWRSNKAIAEDLREAFDELCTLWNNHEVCLYFSFKIQHWILTKFRNKQNNISFVVINVYMPINPIEKATCWRSILRLKHTEFSKDCIVASDFNVIRNNAEKRGGNFGGNILGENF